MTKPIFRIKARGEGKGDCSPLCHRKQFTKTVEVPKSATTPAKLYICKHGLMGTCPPAKLYMQTRAARDLSQFRVCCELSNYKIEVTLRDRMEQLHVENVHASSL